MKNDVAVPNLIRQRDSAPENRENHQQEEQKELYYSHSITNVQCWSPGGGFIGDPLPAVVICIFYLSAVTGYLCEYW